MSHRSECLPYRPAPLLTGETGHNRVNDSSQLIATSRLYERFEEQCTTGQVSKEIWLRAVSPQPTYRCNCVNLNFRSFVFCLRGNSQKSPLLVWGGDLGPYPMQRFLGSHESVRQRHLDQFGGFCTAYSCAQQPNTYTQTTDACDMCRKGPHLLTACGRRGPKCAFINRDVNPMPWP